MLQPVVSDLRLKIGTCVVIASLKKSQQLCTESSTGRSRPSSKRAMQVAVRNEKRRCLDAQRGKCRVRLGCHLDEWCSLKEHLGFSLHSQLAKFLLDSYKSETKIGSPADPARVSLLSVSLPSLHRLAVSCHQHGKDCHFPPYIQSMPICSGLQEAKNLLWKCRADHYFHWDPNEEAAQKEMHFDCTNISERQNENNREGINKMPLEMLGKESLENVTVDEDKNQRAVREEDSGIETIYQNESKLSRSLDDSEQQKRSTSEKGQFKTLVTPKNGLAIECLQKSTSRKTIQRLQDPKTVQAIKRQIADQGSTEPVPCRRSSRKMKGTHMIMNKREVEVQERLSELVEPSHKKRKITSKAQALEHATVHEPTCDLEKSADITHIQKLSSETGLVIDWEREEGQGSQLKRQSGDTKSQSSIFTRSQVDNELAQICTKRIRKATPCEILLCEFEDCGKIFSKRQYLNYHQKYQHMNQRTFHCSSPDCGSTFNFKKHLKEHEKRHSDRRDYICEFCARAFRSSSNLIIHRRIHTGEKPLQCEFCGFTCRQKASLNWHMKKHDADSFYQFPCEICGQRFEKRENLAAHRSRKHPTPRDIASQETVLCETNATASVSETAHHQMTFSVNASRTATLEAEDTPISSECLDLTDGEAEENQDTDTTTESTIPDSDGVSAKISLVIIV